jgi:hypothetical protein
MINGKDIEKLSEIFVTKDDLERSEQKIEDKIVEFKSEILNGQDKILEKLEALSQEKTFKGAQDKRKTKVLEIHNDALKTKKILSANQLTQIKELHAF